MRPFVPARWLPNGHFQTIWASKIGRGRGIQFGIERYIFSDSDETNLAWFPHHLSLTSLSEQAIDTPIVVVLHGLEGSAESNYIRGLMQQISALGWQAVVLHFRGCHNGPNKLDRGYHSGDTNDLREFMMTVKTQAPNAPIYAVGYSMGGNVLLKYLGEYANDARIDAAVAVSVPFKLDHAATRLTQGFSKTLSTRVALQLKQKFFEKFADKTCPLDKASIAAVKTIWAWDDVVTAPLHGFNDAADYYARSSCYPLLSSITTPTLLLHAEDDPLVPPTAIPGTNDQSKLIEMECYARGGHVAFVAGRNPVQPDYWLDRRIAAFLCGSS